MIEMQTSKVDRWSRTGRPRMVLRNSPLPTANWSLPTSLPPTEEIRDWNHDSHHFPEVLKQRALFELMEWKHPFKRRMLIKHFCYCTASRNTGEKHPPLNPAACYDVSTMEICLSARSSASFGTSPVLSSLLPVHLCLPLTGTLSKTSLRGNVLKLIHRRRQWHPTPVLLPGKPKDGGAW